MNPALDDTTPGIRLRVYPTSIPDAALARLIGYMNTWIVVRAPTFASWLIDVFVDEQARRLRGIRQDFREPAPIDFPALLWTDAEVGAALIVIDVLYRAASERHERRFLEHVRALVVVLASRRLEKPVE